MKIGSELNPRRETYTLETELRHAPAPELHVTVSNPRYGKLSAVMAWDNPEEELDLPAVRTRIKGFADALFERLSTPA